MSVSKLPPKKMHRLYECPIFRAKVHLLLGYTEAEVNRKLKRPQDTVDDLVMGSVAWVLQLPKGRLALWIGPHKTVSDLRDTIVHETNHISRFILEGVGITLCTETQEVYAYYQSFWFNHISELIWGKAK